MRRFYAAPENFNNETVTLDAEESKHLRDVLRLRAGGRVYVFDGGGNEFSCEIKTIGRRETVLKVLETAAPKSPESNLNLTLGIALLKGEKFDLVVQKTCELGVSKIVPLETARADVKIRDAKEAAKKLDRWRRIALEAAKQSGRAKLMQIGAPVSLEKYVESAIGNRIFFAERGGGSFENLPDKDVSQVSAIVGAEGGWEDSEIEAARAEGFQIVTLGGRILRAETAAIIAATLLQNRFGDLK